MAELNINVPPIECFVREEFMRQMKDGHGRVHPCIVFGMASIANQAPLFHFLMADGGVWWRMPLAAFCQRDGVEALPLDETVLWDAFSYHVTCTRFDLLANKRMRYRSRSNTERDGRYLFTLDWYAPDGAGFAETPGQHKCGHVIALDDGNFALQPNNRVLVFEPSFTTRYGQPPVERLVSDRIWTVEDQPKWRPAEGERYDTPMQAPQAPDGSTHPYHRSPSDIDRIRADVEESRRSNGYGG